MKRVARNQPCPCGSGKKYKACCGTGDKTRSGAAGGKILGIVIGIVVIAGVLIVLNMFRTADLSEQIPEPWEYNAATNQHYNPLPGHEHMHPGPPPNQGGGIPTIATVPVPQAAPAVAAPPADGSPAPWDYDAENDRHWNPATQAWDAGMPPLEAFTSDAN